MDDVLLKWMQMIAIYLKAHHIHWPLKVMVDVRVTFNNNGLQPTFTVPFTQFLNGTVFNQWREVRPLSDQQP